MRHKLFKSPANGDNDPAKAKLKSVRHKFRQSMNCPNKKTGFGQVIYKYYDICLQIWGDEYNLGLPTVCPMEYNGDSQEHNSNARLDNLFVTSPKDNHGDNGNTNSNCGHTSNAYISTPAAQSRQLPKKRMHDQILPTYVTSDDEELETKRPTPTSLEQAVYNQNRKMDQLSHGLQNLTKLVTEGFSNISKTLNPPSPSRRAAQPNTLDDCPWGETTNVRTLIVRLFPGMPLKQSLLDFCRRRGVISASISTCVGSLTRAKLRLANGTIIKQYEGPFEILSLVGIIAGSQTHLHVSLGDKEGHVIGGHLVGEDLVYTTAEVVICEMRGLTLTREPCSLSGWPELVIKKKPLTESVSKAHI